MIRVQSPFYQNLSVTHFFENHHSSHNCGTILFPKSTLRRVYFYQLFFFSLSVASSKALRDVLSFNEIWNIHRKVFFKNSCSEYFPEIPRKTSATELMFNIVVSFQYALCYKWFSRNFPKIFRTSLSKNTAGEALLISSDYSLKVSGTPFNPLTLCG